MSVNFSDGDQKSKLLDESGVPANPRTPTCSNTPSMRNVSPTMSPI